MSGLILGESGLFIELGPPERIIPLISSLLKLFKSTLLSINWAYTPKSRTLLTINSLYWEP